MYMVKTFDLHDASADDFLRSVNMAVSAGFPDAKKAVVQRKINGIISFTAPEAEGNAICQQFNKIKQIGQEKNGPKVRFDGRTLIIPDNKSIMFFGMISSIFGSDKVTKDSYNNEILISSPTKDNIITLYNNLHLINAEISGLSDVVSKLESTTSVEVQSILKIHNIDSKIAIDISDYKNPDQILNIINECFPSTSDNFVSSFPSHEVINYPSPYGEMPRTICFLSGNKNDFFRLLRVCESRGFNTEQAKRFFDTAISSGIIKESRIDGEVDIEGGEEKLNQHINEIENNFAEHILKTKKQAGVKIKEKQIEGIKFLFTHQSAILGDEPGVGKSLQLISAAYLRLKASGGRCLIITKPIVVNQLAKEIYGMTKSNSISTEYSKDAEWMVLPYSIFGNDRLREKVTSKLVQDAKSGKITVMILDESHTIKNGDPSERDPTGGMNHKSQNTTFNIQDISRHVPFVWGASATMVANIADDVYNQLKAVNHTIGNMSFSKFKERFTHPSDHSKRLEKADELRQALIDHGIYIQRSKKQVEPNLPSLITSEQDVSITDSQIKELAAQKSAGKQAGVMYERMAAADLKTSNSASKAEESLKQGKKVAIFTGFNSSRKLLVQKLQAILAKLGMNTTVFSIYGEQDSEQRDLEVSAFKDPDSPVMAIVINLQAGGTGVDFPNVLDNVIINDFDWAPSTDIQSINRFFRINSKQDVNVTYMVARNTTDEIIYKRLQLKKQIADAIAVLNDEESRLIAEKRGSSDAQLQRTREERRKLMIRLMQEEEEDKKRFSD
jgi:SWI/SNF-related matrix-associated actin-dependent regulator 1 of chromatin subfamily A